MNTDVHEDPMMKRLIEALEAKSDIGHYGRLVFTMIARHFMKPDEVVQLLQNNPGVDAEQAQLLFDEVTAADYSPPKREKILDYQSQQEFQMIENIHDPDAGNVYRSLKFPDHVYQHIEEYREQKAHA